jgi:protein ImuB
MAAFAARALAERLHARLAGHGLAATRLGIEAHTAAGEELHRTWRHDGLLDAAAIADRLRWQLDGWLSGTARVGALTGALPPRRPTAGIDRLRLEPGGVVAARGMQPGLWGELGEADARARRALVRVQGMLGPEAVVTAVIGGGRGYADRVRLVAWGDERSPGRPGGDEGGGPWPGRLPAPAPAIVLTEPAPAAVLAADGSPVAVTARLGMTGEPAWVAVAGGRPVEVTAWAGPWPADERWWAPEEAARLVRFQVELADGRALLMALTGGQWRVEANYD